MQIAVLGIDLGCNRVALDGQGMVIKRRLRLLTSPISIEPVA